jgi:glycogen operon protein
MNTPERPLHDYVADVCEHTDVRRGTPLPLGVHESEGGVNFALFSRHASRIRLALFDLPLDATPKRVIDLDPARNRTGDVWHVWVEGIPHGQLYAWRVDGPYQPWAGHRFNVHKLLLDPFATAIARMRFWDFGPARARSIVQLCSQERSKLLGQRRLGSIVRRKCPAHGLPRQLAGWCWVLTNAHIFEAA